MLYLVEMFPNGLQRPATLIPMARMQYLYLYLILCVCCYASSQGAPIAVVIPVVMVLTLPNLRKQPRAQVLTVETIAHSLNAFVFAVIAYAIGRGIASIVAP
jgi:hypothetical protein